MIEDKIYFEREVRIQGGSYIVTLPPEIAGYMKLKDRTTIRFIPDTSKHGRFTGVWNPKQQEKR
jgi:hypothetical protein